MLITQKYRGYIYTLVGDEICCYLGSRFYSPQLGRFINADKHVDTGTGVIGTNMYAYCNNNPMKYVDHKGEARTSNRGLSSILAAFLIGVILESFIYYLNPNMEIAPYSKIKIDGNYIISADARYKNLNISTKWYILLFAIKRMFL